MCIRDSLYKGRVSKVLPGMQSAFVDLGLERDGFLYVSDVVANTEEFDRLETEEEEDGGSSVDGNGSGGARPTQAVRRPGTADGAASGGGPGVAPPRGGRRDRERGPEPKIEELL